MNKKAMIVIAPVLLTSQLEHYVSAIGLLTIIATTQKDHRQLLACERYPPAMIVRIRFGITYG
jgi:hypothetical protein